MPLHPQLPIVSCIPYNVEVEARLTLINFIQRIQTPRRPLRAVTAAKPSSNFQHLCSTSNPTAALSEGTIESSGR